MAKIIKFPPNGASKGSTVSASIIKLKNASDAIDDIIVGCLNDPSLDPKEIAGVLAHRLGSLIKNMDHKEKLWQIYQRVAEKQAEIGDEAV
jgi:hypothetical protein